MPSVFKPKQIIHIDGKAIKEFLGSATESVARDFLQALAPFPAGSHIHDNGCGSGAVTEAIVGLHTSRGDISLPLIAATDNNSAPLVGLRTAAQRGGWPVQVDVMDCRELGFAVDTFSHSFASFVFLQVWPDDARAAREIYRTLALGGLALVTAWEDLATMAVFRQSHTRLHNGARELPEMLQTYWYGGEQVRKAMLEAGFDESRMRAECYSTKVRIEDATRWCEIGWSICGKPRDGWTQEDEDTWDEAIRLARESLVTGPWYQRDEDDENMGWLHLTASAILAIK